MPLLYNNIKLYIPSLHRLLADWCPRIRRLPNLDFHPLQLHVPFGCDRQWPGYGDGDLGQKPPWTHVSLLGHASSQSCCTLYHHSAHNAYLLAGPFHINILCLSHTDVFRSCSIFLWICCRTGHGFWPLCGYLCTTPLYYPTYRLSHEQSGPGSSGLKWSGCGHPWGPTHSPPALLPEQHHSPYLLWEHGHCQIGLQ